MFHLVLYEPAIPGNAGSLARMCVGLGAHLHLVGPFRFDLSTRALRRAGLDYWQGLRWSVHADGEGFLAWLGARTPVLVSVEGSVRYDRIAWARGDVIVLGNENRGLPRDWHARFPQRIAHIPMPGPVRSFNVANVGAVLLCEAMRATGSFSTTDATAQSLPGSLPIR